MSTQSLAPGARFVRELGARTPKTCVALRHDVLVVLACVEREDAPDADARLDAAQRDARALALNAFPNVARVREVERVGVNLVLTYDLVEGVTWGDFVAAAERQKVSIPVDIATRVLVDALAGLFALHALRDKDRAPLDFYHGEISPESLIVALDGTARVINACRTKPARVTTGRLARYAAPELLLGDSTMDARVDQYAVGAMLWEALAGEALFAGKGRAEILEELLAKGAPPVPKRDVPFADALAEIAARALSVDPKNRYPRTQDMTGAIRRVLGAKLAPASKVAALADLLTGEAVRQRRAAMEAAARGPEEAAASNVDDLGWSAPPPAEAEPTIEAKTAPDDDTIRRPPPLPVRDQAEAEALLPKLNDDDVELDEAGVHEAPTLVASLTARLAAAKAAADKEAPTLTATVSAPAACALPATVDDAPTLEQARPPFEDPVAPPPIHAPVAAKTAEPAASTVANAARAVAKETAESRGATLAHASPVRLSESPRVESPRVAPPKIDSPKASPAKIELAKIELAKIAPPKVDAPRAPPQKVEPVIAAVTVAPVPPPVPQRATSITAPLPPPLATPVAAPPSTPIEIAQQSEPVLVAQANAVGPTPPSFAQNDDAVRPTFGDGLSSTLIEEPVALPTQRRPIAVVIGISAVCILVLLVLGLRAIFGSTEATTATRDHAMTPASARPAASTEPPHVPATPVSVAAASPPAPAPTPDPVPPIAAPAPTPESAPADTTPETPAATPPHATTNAASASTPRAPTRTPIKRPKTPAYDPLGI